MPALRSLVAAASLSCATLATGLIGVATAQARGPSSQAAAVKIRLDAGESVPACVTPARLMAHVRERTPRLDARFADIARYYKQHGETLRVRWDYAFYQMLIETNYLSYKTGAGRWGDVDPKQNNFAGIGTTGGGVPGDSFRDVSSGVLGQIQHLVAYSGERVVNPIAPRTSEKQDEIIEKSLKLRRPVMFSDLARRWAVDWRYASSIEYVAQRYRAANCNAEGLPLHASPDPAEDAPSREARRETVLQPARAATVPPASQPMAPTLSAVSGCGIWSASYGGQVALLIRSVEGGMTNYTVLQVDAGEESAQAQAFMQLHAQNGEMLARFPTSDAAFARAFELCPRPS